MDRVSPCSSVAVEKASLGFCCSSSTRFGRPCDFAVTSLKGFFAVFPHFRAPPGCPGVERQFQQWESPR